MRAITESQFDTSTAIPIAVPAAKPLTESLPDRSAILQGVQKFCGAAMSIAGLSLLVLPFGAADFTQLLSKMMVALILGFAGAALWQAGSPRRQPELELDPVRREARLVCRHGGKSKLVARRKFKDLDRAEISDDHVRLWDADGAILADVALADANMARLVRRTLSMAGVRT